jgi:hypothetical protein
MSGAAGAGPDRAGPPARGALVLLILPALLAPVALWIAAASGRPFVLPLLATAAIYPIFAAFLMAGRPLAAATAAVLWAASLSVSIIAVTMADPARLAPVIVNGAAYRDEMISWVATGIGRESDPARFIPQHLLHLAAFILLALASAGLLGLLLGAVLVGYMSFYVGVLASGPEPVRGALIGWPPYAVVRVVAYIVLGTVLARPLLGRLARRPLPPMSTRRWIGVAAALLVLDIVLKTLLAARWAAYLRPCLPGDAP